MPEAGSESEFPRGTADERELFLRWLGFLRGAVLRKIDGLSEDQLAELVTRDSMIGTGLARSPQA